MTALTNSSGTVTKRYSYDAFGNEVNPSSDANPFRYCGEYFDKETQTYYLRARYYDPAIGRFTQQDSLLFTTRKLASGYEYVDPLSLNLYTYCSNNAIMFIDPTGHQRAAGYYTINGIYGWYNNPDAAEFSVNSDTYKIINDASRRWFATNDPAERQRLHEIAEAARAHYRAGTPYMYGQERVWNTLIKNAQMGIGYQNAAKNVFSHVALDITSYLWFVGMTCFDWDYKRNAEWQVPYATFDGNNMNTSNRKNWTAWIYFEGQIWGADKIGNINLGFVGTAMGFGGLLIKNFATMDKDDGPAVTLGIELANRWLTNCNG